MNPYRFWFRSTGWRAIWIALRRAPRDPHARRNLLRLLPSCLPFFAYIGWYVFFIHGALVDLGREGLLVMACSAGFALLLTLAISYSQRREDRVYDRDNPAVATEIKLGIYRETCLLATLLERLGSEVGMEKGLPPNITVITQRELLDRLAQLKLRVRTPPGVTSRKRPRPSRSVYRFDVGPIAWSSLSVRGANLLLFWLELFFFVLVESILVSRAKTDYTTRLETNWRLNSVRLVANVT